MSASPTFATLTQEARMRPPQVALVLGSGMSALAKGMRVVCRLPFVEVPGLETPSVAGHGGCVTLGEWVDRRVLVFEGRLHYYEGYSWRQVVQPVHTAAFLGAPALLLTNAAGGIHDALGPGSLLAIRDHIEWTRPTCWRHPGLGGLGAARPAPYSLRLTQLLTQAAERLGLPLHQGIYASVTGPSYETPAEIRALKAWGADAVGMSTTREAQAGYDLGMECAALSCITNRAAGLSTGPIHHGEVLQTAKASQEVLIRLVEEFLRTLPTGEG